MEVTKTNFRELLPKIKTAIDQADCISIDCEFTGLYVGSNINAYDTQPLYYEKVRKAAKDFLVVQYGLCMFRYDAQEKKFKQQAYNFYIFPRPANRLVPDRKFLCQASSLDFLMTQGFDFNKLFKEGIPYLNSIEEDKYKEDLSSKQKVRATQIQNTSTPNEKSNSGISMTVEDKEKVDDIFKKINKFINGSEEELILPRCNAFIRRLVYGEASCRLENKVSLETRILENKDRVLVATRPKSKKVLEEEDQKKVEEEEEEFKSCIGFAEVIKYIVESGKLVIGHNMFLDLLHTIEKFLAPLPDDYDEFKELASSTFSNIVDTKYMSSISPFKNITDSNVLSHLLETVKKDPFTIPVVEVEEGAQGYKLDCDKAHEAGYDAFITGISFLAMWLYLGKIKDSEDPYSIFTDNNALDPYKNRVFLMKIQDISCIDLAGKDVMPSRDHVLHITFPKEWKFSDITNLFSPFGNVNIAWIDDQSAYVGLQSHEKTIIALSTLSQSDRYTVTTYAKQQAYLERCKLPYSLKERPLEILSTPVKKSLESKSFEEDVGELLPSSPSKLDVQDNSWTVKTYKKGKKTSFQISGKSDTLIRGRNLDTGSRDNSSRKRSFDLIKDVDKVEESKSQGHLSKKAKKAFNESAEWN